MMLGGKVAVITGAGSGIGRATAKRVAREGAAVVCADVKGADDAVEEIRGDGGKALAVEMDVRDGGGWSEAVARAQQDLGGIDLLGNIAGVVSSQSDTVLEQSGEEWDRIVAVNLRGAWLGMKAVLPGMIEKGGGRIVNIASEAALIGIPGLAAYSATKGAIAALTRQAAIEYVTDGVMVNAIAPGFIRTAIQDGIDPALLDDMAADIPIKRIGQPSDIAGAIAYLFSGDAAYVTGQVLAVDGGWGVA